MRSKPDHYTIRARKEGYPARSVYKLKELDEKLQLLPKSGQILDIGAAPGSWSLYARRRGKGRLRIVAVDLQQIRIAPEPETTLLIQGDVFSGEVQQKLHEEAPFDLIMSDAAPATTGNRTVDCGRSSSLVEGILSLAPGLLARGGSLVMKIFQGGQEKRILNRMQEDFTTARMMKPKACRNESFETFLIGINYHGKK
ncbi:RlmE family RNA methyltransferase [Marispirochaeta aestuarii]|uniref:RlmE family RNA methyltransferase n=1 Tax=Marispirochaeta aestuarii TaxID=1963862 RepID=UPI0029C67A03|nr:RlmE family RNA methyltransferase [Marispirochaeta aestuarii]